jgi:murein L,D-transpeptidase YcbB/YkuD
VGHGGQSPWADYTQGAGAGGDSHNLGYIAGASDDLEDEQLVSALQEFQCDYGLKVDGVCGASTQAKLKETHGS